MEDFVCNHCKEAIGKFRFHCLMCHDFDLCERCSSAVDAIEKHDPVQHTLLKIQIGDVKSDVSCEHYSNEFDKWFAVLAGIEAFKLDFQSIAHYIGIAVEEVQKIFYEMFDDDDESIELASEMTDVLPKGCMEVPHSEARTVRCLEMVSMDCQWMSLCSVVSNKVEGGLELVLLEQALQLPKQVERFSRHRLRAFDRTVKIAESLRRQPDFQLMVYKLLDSEFTSLDRNAAKLRKEFSVAIREFSTTRTRTWRGILSRLRCGYFHQYEALISDSYGTDKPLRSQHHANIRNQRFEKITGQGAKRKYGPSTNVHDGCLSPVKRNCGRSREKHDNKSDPRHLAAQCEDFNLIGMLSNSSEVSMTTETPKLAPKEFVDRLPRRNHAKRISGSVVEERGPLERLEVGEVASQTLLSDSACGDVNTTELSVANSGFTADHFVDVDVLKEELVPHVESTQPVAVEVAVEDKIDIRVGSTHAVDLVGGVSSSGASATSPFAYDQICADDNLAFHGSMFIDGEDALVKGLKEFTEDTCRVRRRWGRLRQQDSHEFGQLVPLQSAAYGSVDSGSVHSGSAYDESPLETTEHDSERPGLAPKEFVDKLPRRRHTKRKRESAVEERRSLERLEVGEVASQCFEVEAATTLLSDSACGDVNTVELSVINIGFTADHFVDVDVLKEELVPHVESTQPVAVEVAVEDRIDIRVGSTHAVDLGGDALSSNASDNQIGVDEDVTFYGSMSVDKEETYSRGSKELSEDVCRVRGRPRRRRPQSSREFCQVVPLQSAAYASVDSGSVHSASVFDDSPLEMTEHDDLEKPGLAPKEFVDRQHAKRKCESVAEERGSLERLEVGEVASQCLEADAATTTLLFGGSAYGAGELDQCPLGDVNAAKSSVVDIGLTVSHPVDIGILKEELVPHVESMQPAACEVAVEDRIDVGLAHTADLGDVSSSDASDTSPSDVNGTFETGRTSSLLHFGGVCDSFRRSSLEVLVPTKLHVFPKVDEYWLVEESELVSNFESLVLVINEACCVKEILLDYFPTNSLSKRFEHTFLEPIREEDEDVAERENPQISCSARCGDNFNDENFLKGCWLLPFLTQE